MNTARLYTIGLVVIILLTISERASAQIVDFYSSPGYTRMIDNLINNHIWNKSMERYTKGATKTKSGSPGVSKSTPPSQPSSPIIADYRKYPTAQFKPTGTRLMVQDRADKFGKTPEERADWKALMLETFDRYEAVARAKGYPNDLALAYVSFIELSKRMYHGITDKPLLPYEINIGRRDMIAQHATDSGTYSKLSDMEKQQLYEVFVIYGAVFYELYRIALEEQNTELMKFCKLHAAANLELAG